ncbi:MAG: ribonuclease T [Pseudomonadota bacterium]
MSVLQNIINDKIDYVPLGNRFRGFCPVVVDVETGGFNSQTDALLEVAAIILGIDANGKLYCKESHQVHVQPFEGANIEPASLAVNGIDPYHPLRIAIPEKEALKSIFKPIRAAVKENICKRAILVGHNATFDLNFIHTSANRAKVKNNPFHPFSALDTVTLGAMAYGQTVLSRMAQQAGLDWNNENAHSAIYDARMTAELFCKILNTWNNQVKQILPVSNPALTQNEEDDDESET